jgi:hypothetical protein
MAGLLTALAFQQNALTDLKEAQQDLTAKTPRLAAQSQTEAENLLESELELLRKQSVELAALRAEMAEIQRLLARQPQLTAENEALRSELSSLTRNNPEASPEIQAVIAQARQKAERIRCVNNLKNAGLAARVWASDNGDKQHLPTDFVTMKSELSTPHILICPSDPVRAQALTDDNWERFATVGSSYELLSPGVSEQFPGAVFARCPFHNNVALVDGSVHQLAPDQQLIQRKGYWEVKR